MRHLLSALFFALTAAGAIAGEDPQELDRLLASSFGGLTESDEPPAFGDAELLAPAFQTVDRKVKDDLALPHGDRRDAEHARMLVVWGYLAPHPDATEVVDWSGSITVTNAGLRVLRTIRFEENDVVVRPRTDIHAVAFESHTRPAADGLLLDVVIALSLNPSGGPVTLTFQTAPFRETITIEPGQRLTRIVPVDDAGHVVAYHIIRPDADGCAEGFLSGIRRTKAADDGRELGVLKGLFTADDGRLRGHLRGVFGVRENGHQVWFAKVVDRDGAFLGILAGRYGEGQLAGLFLGEGRKVRGVVRGRYIDGDSRHDGGFVGRYSLRCEEDAREGDRVEDDEPDVTLDDDDR
jgi:hypothetical protein